MKEGIKSFQEREKISELYKYCFVLSGFSGPEHFDGGAAEDLSALGYYNGYLSAEEQHQLDTLLKTLGERVEAHLREFDKRQLKAMGR